MTNATAKATIHTNYGDIVVELFGNHAPLTVENFIGLADGSRQWKHPRTGEIMNTPLYKDFGEVTDEASKKVVDAIEGVETGFQDRPVKDVVISSIDIEKL